MVVFSRKEKAISRKRPQPVCILTYSVCILTYSYVCILLPTCKRGAKLSFQAVSKKIDFV